VKISQQVGSPKPTVIERALELLRAARSGRLELRARSTSCRRLRSASAAPQSIDGDAWPPFINPRAGWSGMVPCAPDHCRETASRRLGCSSAAQRPRPIAETAVDSCRSMLRRDEWRDEFVVMMAQAQHVCRALLQVRSTAPAVRLVTGRTPAAPPPRTKPAMLMNYGHLPAYTATSAESATKAVVSALWFPEENGPSITCACRPRSSWCVVGRHRTPVIKSTPFSLILRRIGDRCHGLRRRGLE